MTRAVGRGTAGRLWLAWWAIAAAALLLASSGDALASLHRCKAVDGTVSYRDTPCDDDEVAKVESMPGGAGAISPEARDAMASAGFHPSWFAAPPYLASQVRCTESLCACGDDHISLQKDRLSALLDAMLGLPGDWKALDSGVQRWNEMGSRQSKFPAIREQLERSACRVAMRQRIAAKLYAQVAPATIESHQAREQAVDSIDAQCKKPDETGWTQSEAAKEWVRCLDRNRQQHNQAVRARRQTSGGYNALLDAIDALQRPRGR